MKVSALATIVLALSACATPASDPARAEAARPLTCAAKPQCDLAWQKVQAWIAQNSYWRIQIANDVTVQTFGPGQSKVETAYSAVRTLNADGSGVISIRAACDNIFGCRPEPTSAIQAIKAYAAQ